MECAKALYRPRTEIRRSKGRFFCTKSCFMSWKNKHILSGENHARWKNGENAYRAIMLRETAVPSCEKCGLRDIRILVVHHIDRNRKNNVPGNLKWLCRNCHYLEHKGKTF